MDNRPDDARWMRRAIELALGAKPSPNPCVGAVVVRDGERVGEGLHLAAGSDHAEVAALRQAGARALGSTVYVTLEPCNHFGRTPPCTAALLGSGVSRVVVGVRDPNPSVAGQGIERLQAAGVEVTLGVEPEACERLIRAWRKHVTVGMPFVTLKTGMSLDGRIATHTGASRWITGDAARRDAHALRARADAILVGVGTVLADDPSLTVRDAPMPGAPPVRIVLDTELRTPLTSTLVRTARESPVWVLHAIDAPPERAAALAAHGVELFALPRKNGRVALAEALRLLGRRGITELLVEGGAAVHGALIDERLGDALVCYIAPLVLGGDHAVPAFGGEGVATPADAHRLTGLTFERIGGDLKASAEFAHVYRNRDAGG